MPRDKVETMSGMMKGMSKQMMDMSYCMGKGVVSTKDVKNMRENDSDAEKCPP
jgi:hypothetical protein